MKYYFSSLFVLFLVSKSMAQTSLQWNADYELQISDFQSASTEINDTLTMYMINSGSQMDFSFSMSGYEFMFTKNFNSKVKTVFFRNQSVLIAPNNEIAQQLVNFGQYEFDLTELYSRKFRKALFDNKGAFSSVEFFKPLYDELREEMAVRHGKVSKESDIGRNDSILGQARQEVLLEIAELSYFCFDCKPPKKKKNKDSKNN